MSYYAQLLLAYRKVSPRMARRYATDILAGSPAPYMAGRS